VLRASGASAGGLPGCSLQPPDAACTALRLTTAQFAHAAPIVARRMSDLLKSTRVRSTAQMITPRRGRIGPPGRRQSAAAACLRRRTGTATHTAAEENSRATADSVTFQEKLADSEKPHRSSANRSVDAYGVGKRA